MAVTATQSGDVNGRGALWPLIRGHVLLVASLVGWIGGFFTLDSLIERSPLEEPISLDPPGNIDTNIWIPLRERYFLEFEFSRRGHTFEQLQQLIGDWVPPPTDGVPVTISWSLASRTNGVIAAEGTVVTKGASGWGPDVYRQVDTIRVAPGRYRFTARIVNPVTQLASIPTRLALSNNFKTTDTWQSGALFFGALFTAWIVTPVAAVLAVSLAVRVGLHYLRKHRARAVSS